MPSDPPDTAEGDEAYCAACNQSFRFDHVFCPNDGARLIKLKARPDQLIGRVFDNRYEIRSTLGHGGMGTVYRGWQLSVDREVAIKVIHPKLASVRAVAKRFLREARLSSRLNQPNIVNVYDFGQTDDGILYLVMELLRGHPLARDLEAAPLPLRRIATFTSQICDALEAAHNQGIIHRDLKPQNIVILDEPPGRDFLKILDFGLAKSLLAEPTSLVTQSDALLGTPLYMSPEQILGKQSDPRTDLYSLGCMLYQMVSGRPPYIGDNVNVILGAHIRGPVPPLPDGTSPQLATTILRLMNKTPDDRLPTAAAVRDAVAACIASSTPVPDVAIARAATVPSHAEAAPTSPSISSVASVAPEQRRWRPVLLALLVVSVAVIAIAFVLSSRKPATPGDGVDGRAGTTGSSDGSGSAAGPAGTLADATIEIDAAALAVPAVPVDAAVPDARAVDARVAADARAAEVRAADARAADARTGAADARTAIDTRVPPALPHVNRPDAGVPVARPLTIDAAAPPAIDAGMPDLDLLPTKRGSHR